MKILVEDIDLVVSSEVDMLNQILTLEGRDVLEIGCGNAEKTRGLAGKAKSVVATEVDVAQLYQNVWLAEHQNIVFRYGGAQDIPSSDAEFDLVFMFKSLHHVPAHLMDKAFAEIGRVLRPAGYVYISEPIYAGAFNEILKIFNDEEAIRKAAFEAVQRAVESGGFSLVEQYFFRQKLHFKNFADFEAKVINVTHSNHQLSPTQMEEVKKKFERHMSAGGADLNIPIRVDLLKKNGAPT